MLTRRWTRLRSEPRMYHFTRFIVLSYRTLLHILTVGATVNMFNKISICISKGVILISSAHYYTMGTE